MPFESQLMTAKPGSVLFPIPQKKLLKLPNFSRSVPICPIAIPIASPDSSICPDALPCLATP